ncbi:hypothetical protein Anas_12438, partial [Armadillidium nasatum]
MNVPENVELLCKSNQPVEDSYSLHKLKYKKEEIYKKKSNLEPIKQDGVNLLEEDDKRQSMKLKSSDQESKIIMVSIDPTSQTFEMLEEDYSAAGLNTKVASPIVKLDNLQSNKWWEPNVSTYLLPKILRQIPTEENVSSDVNYPSDPSPPAGTKIKIINYKYECDHCNLKTITTERFWQHLFKCHIKKEKNVSKVKEYYEIDSNESININKQIQLMYSCLYCDFQASFENRLRLH